MTRTALAALIQSGICLGLDRAAGEQLGAGRRRPARRRGRGASRAAPDWRGRRGSGRRGRGRGCAARLRAGQRPKRPRSGPQGSTAEPGTAGSPGRPSSSANRAPRDGGDQVGAPGQAARERADDPVADVGAVEGDDQRPRAGQPRAPARQPVVGVDEVEALAAQQATAAAGSPGCSRPGRGGS